MRIGRWTGAMLVLVSFAFRPSAADACTCDSNCAIAAEADAVFEATVTSVEIEKPTSPVGSFSRTSKRVRLQDVRAWRGHPLDVVFTNLGGGDCGYDFRVGTRYVIVAHRSPENGQLWTSICSMTQPLADAAGFREYVQSLSTPSKGGHLWGRVAMTGVSRGPGSDQSVTPVVARVSADGPVNKTFATEADGRYAFTALPPGKYTVSVTLPASRPELAALEPQTITFDRAYACAVLNFSPRLMSEISGAVVDESDKPVAGLSVYLLPVGWTIESQMLSWGEQTDARGHYRFSNIPPGRYLVGISIAMGPDPRKPHAVTYGRTAAGEMELTMPQMGGSIDVQPMVMRRLTPVRTATTVRWSDGSPAAEIMLFADVLGEQGPVRAPIVAKTGLEGSVDLDLFPNLRYRFRLERAGRVVHRVEVVATGDPVAITLPIP